MPRPLETSEIIKNNKWAVQNDARVNGHVHSSHSLGVLFGSTQTPLRVFLNSAVSGASAPPSTMGQQKVFENETAFPAAKRATTSSTGHLLIRNKFFGLDPHKFVFAHRSDTGMALRGSPACQRSSAANVGSVPGTSKLAIAPQRAYSQPPMGE